MGHCIGDCRTLGDEADAAAREGNMGNELFSQAGIVTRVIDNLDYRFDISKGSALDLAQLFEHKYWSVSCMCLNMCIKYWHVCHTT